MITLSTAVPNPCVHIPHRILNLWQQHLFQRMQTLNFGGKKSVNCRKVANSCQSRDPKLGGGFRALHLVLVLLSRSRGPCSRGSQPIPVCRGMHSTGIAHRYSCQLC